MTIISIIIPCYYNQENIPSTIEKLLSIESKLDKQTEGHGLGVSPSMIIGKITLNL